MKASPRRHIFFISLLLTLATIALYAPVGWHPFIAYDDGHYIVDNPWVTSGLSWAGAHWAFTTFHEANWHPLTWLSHQLDATLFGLWAGGHHLMGLAIHTGNTLLLFLLLQRLSGTVWRSAMVAALFALHPLHVESVAWAAERKDLLCALFFLLTLHAYRRYAGNGSRPAYLLALLGFTAALLAKPMAVTLPFLLLLLDVWPLARTATTSWWRLCREKLPFLFLSAASCVVTVIAQHSGGALVSMERAGIGLRLANAVTSVVKYLWLACWPKDLAVFYPLPEHIPVWQVAGSTVLLTTLLLAVFWQRQRRPYLLFGLLWFLGMLVPVSGLMQVGLQGMADRYTYLPLIGIFVGGVWLVADLTAKWRYRHEIIGTVGVVLLICCSGVTRLQLSFWRSSETLLRQALSVTSGNFSAHIMLGNVIQKQGRNSEALTQYLHAARIQPYNADIHCYLADTLYAAGKLAEAAAQYQIALQLQPDYPEAHNNLGTTLRRQGKLSEAIVHFAEALRLNPNDSVARANLRSAEVDLSISSKKSTPP